MSRQDEVYEALFEGAVLMELVAREKGAIGWTSTVGHAVLTIASAFKTCAALTDDLEAKAAFERYAETMSQLQFENVRARIERTRP